MVRMTREEITNTPPESILSSTWRSILSVAAVKLYTSLWYVSKFINRSSITWSHEERIKRSRLNAEQLLAAECELEYYGLLWKPSTDRYCIVDSSTVEIEVDDDMAWQLATMQLGVSK